MPGRQVALITVGATLVALIAVSVVGFVYAYGQNHENLRFPSQDVTVSSCRRDATTGRPVADIRVTSQAGRRGTYTVPLVFRDLPDAGGEGGAAARSTVVVADLAVGATASRQVTGPVPVLGRAECEIGDVTFLSTAAAATASPSAP
ncbi:hypothetical protein E6P78_18690 [Streptomyces sp. A0958]|nr:hypothetical protein E6P78_18690 [Streptomyces sp. A0958]